MHFLADMTSAIPIVESIPTDVASSRVAIAYVVHWIFLGVVFLLVFFAVGRPITVVLTLTARNFTTVPSRPNVTTKH